MANLLNVNMEDKHTRTHTHTYAGAEASMVYTPLSGPMVYVLFLFSPKHMVYTIALFCSATSKKKTTDRKRKGAAVFFSARKGVITKGVFSLEESLLNFKKFLDSAEYLENAPFFSTLWGLDRICTMSKMSRF